MTWGSLSPVNVLDMIAVCRATRCPLLVLSTDIPLEESLRRNDKEAYLAFARWFRQALTTVAGPAPLLRVRHLEDAVNLPT